MKSEIKYIELKTGYSDNGPAWIGLVSYSKSGKTLYFNGKAFQSMKGTGIYSNYFDLETSEEYWISGVKRNMNDRHWAGGGKIFVEKRVVSDYLKLVGSSELDKSLHKTIDVQTEIPIERINAQENEIVVPKEFDDDLYFRNPKELNLEELNYLISQLEVDEKDSLYNKGRRSIKKKRLELEEELEDRKNINTL